MMKVRVILTVDVDPEGWQEIYSTGVPLRDDVREYVHNRVINSAAAEDGVITGVRLS